MKLSLRNLTYPYDYYPSAFGAALVIRNDNNTAQYGMFDGTSWSGLIDIPPAPGSGSAYFYDGGQMISTFRNTTIKVVNGVLQD